MPQQSSFLSLPNELHLHILSFLIHSDMTQFDRKDRKKCALTIIKFQSLNSKLTQETNQYLSDEFWWKLFEFDLGKNVTLQDKLDELKLKMINKNVLRRKVLLMRYCKFVVMNSRKKDSDDMDCIKMVIMGGARTGKSALTVQFIQGVFVDIYDPTIEDSYRKVISLDGVPVVSEILDTAGQEEFSALREAYIRDSNNFLLTCSLDNSESLNDLKNIVKTIIGSKGDSEITMLFVINKIDISQAERKISIEDCKNSINETIEKFNLRNTAIVQTSATDKAQTDLAFLKCMKMSRGFTAEDLELLGCIIEEDSSILEKFKKTGGKKCQIM